MNAESFQIGDMVKLSNEGKSARVDPMRHWEGIVDTFEHFGLTHKDGTITIETRVRVDWGMDDHGFQRLWLEHPDHLVGI